MKETVYALVLVGVLIVIAVVLFRLRGQAADSKAMGRTAARSPTQQKSDGYVEPETRFVDSPHKKQYQLLNAAEQTLYHRLVEAMPNMTVFCQIGIAQLAQLRGRQAVEEIRDMIGRSVDFLVCMNDFSIVAAIELTWPTDTDPARQRAEEVKRQALEKLGIPLIVFRPHQLPDAETIAQEIASAIIRRNHLESTREKALRH